MQRTLHAFSTCASSAAARPTDCLGVGGVFSVKVEGGRASSALVLKRSHPVRSTAPSIGGAPHLSLRGLERRPNMAARESALPRLRRLLRLPDGVKSLESHFMFLSI